MVVGGLRDQPTPEQLNNAWEEKRSAIRERHEAVQHRVNSLREQGEGSVTQQNTPAALQPGGGLLAQQNTLAAVIQPGGGLLAQQNTLAAVLQPGGGLLAQQNTPAILQPGGGLLAQQNTLAAVLQPGGGLLAQQNTLAAVLQPGGGLLAQQNTLAAVLQTGGGLPAQQSGIGLQQTGEDDVHQSPAITGGQLQAGDVVVQGLQQTGEGDVVPQNSSSYSTTRGLLNSEERLVPRQSSSQTTAGEIALRQDILDVKTTNGVFIWKIPDIRRRYRDTVAGRTISIYSPPFYTSPIGYKMCIRAYLNGDGIGKGTHLSLFFVIMRSDYDPFLEWPFKHSVTLSLMNQRAPSNHIVQTFKPDVESSSFARPTSDTNVASGFPKFASRSVVQDYRFSCRDVMYVKCKVHSSGLRPRGMLRPRAMST